MTKGEIRKVREGARIGSVTDRELRIIAVRETGEKRYPVIVDVEITNATGTYCTTISPDSLELWTIPNGQ